MHNFSDIKLMLDNFAKEKFDSSKAEQNYFEVAGFPHFENVMSNILAFFFDTEGEHEFGDWWLKSLLHVYNSKSIDNYVNEDGNKVVNILREYSGNSSKRIDLLVECEDFLIVIENKIDAGLQNDLEEYIRMAKYYKDDVQIVKIVLSKHKIFEGDNSGFKNITYEELFRELKKNENTEINNKWKILSHEFVNNLEKKGLENMSLDSDWIKFAKDNSKTIRNLNKIIEDDRKKRVEIIKTLNSKLENIEEIKNLNHSVYNSSTSRYVSQFIDFPLNDGNKALCLETYIMTAPAIETDKNFKNEDFSTLYISLWCRKDKHYKGFIDILDFLGASKDKHVETDGWGEHYILETLDVTQEIGTSLVEKIKEYSLNILKYLNRE